MTQHVIDVGQCNPDHASISRLLNDNFSVQVHRAHSHDEAIAMAKESSPSLILINRLLDADGFAGMDVLSTLKADDATREIPVMIVSNYADAQTAAVNAGAVQGFGKSSLNSPATIDLLREHLDSPA